MISFILICLSIIFYIFIQTKNKEVFFKFILPLNIVSCIFIYLVVFKKKQRHSEKIDNKHHIVEKQITESEKTCLKDICQKAATKNECEHYTRCKWNNQTNSCNRKVLQCDDINNKYNCNNSTNDCNWSNNKCSWTKSSDQHDKLLNENKKLNKYCFKAKKYPINDYDLLIGSDYIEDADYVKCIDTNNVDICKTKSRIKLDCESSEGYKFNYKQNKCERIYYNIKGKPKCVTPKNADDHTHILPDVIDNKRKSNLFEMKDEKYLHYLKNIFIILLVILTNICTTKLF